MSHQSTTDNPYTRGIAQFVSGLRYDAIPDEVKHRIKLLMLDSLGCALYGADLEWSRILQDRLGAIDATRACAVWGTAKKLSAPHAALVNGTQVQGFNLAEIIAKFEKLTIKALPNSQVGQLRDAMLGLEKLDDASQLARLLAKQYRT